MRKAQKKTTTIYLKDSKSLFNRIYQDVGDFVWLNQSKYFNMIANNLRYLTE